MEMSMTSQPDTLDLSPARWIWLPSQRTLPNTFVLFRRELVLPAPPVRAAGWITADSRYRLSVNGRRVQWGPAPSDPRWLDADPVDLAPFLRAGPNALGAEVLFYGQGDGTWAAGKPGFIFRLEIECADGTTARVVSDASWQACLDRAHPPGHYKRWYVRALQEQFDARLHPHGWELPGFQSDARWLPAMPLDGPAHRPAVSTTYPDYLGEAYGAWLNKDDSAFQLRARQIPPLRETWVPAARLAETARMAWLRDPDDWFDMRVPGSYSITRRPLVDVDVDGDGDVNLPPAPTERDGVTAIYEFDEQIVGWPAFTIDAPEGTIVELLCQESHDPAAEPWLDTQFFAWTRFVCREGENRFETFDFESLRWLQLHVRNTARPVTLRDVGVRRRQYDWPAQPEVACGEPALQRLFDASLNTLRNSAQETIVDGMARERQQYSGDCGHQLHAVRYAFGETRLARRYLRTWSEGMTLDGYYLDCWPAWDRLARVSQRQVQATKWGPILDHGVGFFFDCWNHYLESGELDALREPYPRLLRFAEYLKSIRGPDGLLPAEDIGVPSVWMDHDAYPLQRHKQCAFNLYAAAALQHALAPVCRAIGDHERAKAAARQGQDLQTAAVRVFWSRDHGLFVNNRPWLAEEGAPRLDDRSLATALLFDQCPNRNAAAGLRALAGCPPEMGLSYPCNAGWRYWALARHGRIDAVLKDLRERWAGMPSVLLNNTLQEEWIARPDSTQQWSHCPVAPLYVLFMDIAGIRPLAPGFARCEVRPQLGDLPSVRLTARTPRGPISFQAEREGGGHRVCVALPEGCEGELLLPPGTPVDLPALAPDHPLGLKRYRMGPGATHVFSTSGITSETIKP
jgi:hypothetical protein